jgi:hypothetical protein
VPVDLLVYTEDEWQILQSRGRRLSREVVRWVYDPTGEGPAAGRRS